MHLPGPLSLALLPTVCFHFFPGVVLAEPASSLASLPVEHAPLDIPTAVREHWMRRAKSALSDLVSPCPFMAFGCVIVNHTASTPDGLGEEVCIGANSVLEGNPLWHGETAAIANCSRILTDPDGPYALSGPEALEAYADLSLYTTAEACPMCQGAILWAGFREYIYATSTATLAASGWSHFNMPFTELFKTGSGLPTRTRLIGHVLREETDPLFAWQYDGSKPCPSGCHRHGGTCAVGGEDSDSVPLREL